jgi:hypothetical protein
MEIPSVPAGRASHDLFGEKTASASESLAHNLAANAANGEVTVHDNHHGTKQGSASRAAKKPLSDP